MSNTQKNVIINTTAKLFDVIAPAEATENTFFGTNATRMNFKKSSNLEYINIQCSNYSFNKLSLRQLINHLIELEKTVL